FDCFVRKDSPEFTPPGFREIGIRAAARSKKEAAMTKIFAQIGDLCFSQNKIVVTVHEKKGCFEELRISQLDFAFVLDFESRCARDKAHKVLAPSAAIIAIIRAVAHPPHKKCGLFVLRLLAWSGGCRDKDGDEQ